MVIRTPDQRLRVFDLGDRFGSSTWLAAWSRVQLGTLSIMGGVLRRVRAKPAGGGD